MPNKLWYLAVTALFVVVDGQPYALAWYALGCGILGIADKAMRHNAAL